MMMKRNLRTNTNKEFAVVMGDCKITANSKNIKSKCFVLEITGREVGFKTYVKLSYNQVARLYDVLLKFDCNYGKYIMTEQIPNVSIKHIRYTQDQNESKFTHKLQEDKHGALTIASIGGQCIVSAIGKDGCYRAISFEIHKYLREFDTFKESIKSCAIEARLQEW